MAFKNPLSFSLKGVLIMIFGQNLSTMVMYEFVQKRFGDVVSAGEFTTGCLPLKSLTQVLWFYTLQVVKLHKIKGFLLNQFLCETFRNSYHNNH